MRGGLVVDVGPVRHANVEVECVVKESMQRAPCWLLAGPLGCHEPTCQRAGVISQGGFRTRPLTNHVSSFVAGPEGSNPRPRRATSALLRTVYIALAGSPLSGYFGCLKRSAAVERWKGEAGSQWLPPKAARQFFFLLWPLQFYEANGREIWGQLKKKQGR